MPPLPSGNTTTKPSAWMREGLSRYESPRADSADPRTLSEGHSHYFDPGSEITRAATSLFQTNSTTSAPMVEVMKPAP
jgi:hypothetical protein